MTADRRELVEQILSHADDRKADQEDKEAWYSLLSRLKSELPQQSKVVDRIWMLVEKYSSDTLSENVDEWVEFVLTGKEPKERKHVALRKVGSKVYRQVQGDGKVPLFAWYDQATGETGAANRIPETGEWPVENLTGVRIPRKLMPYGTPLELYCKLKRRTGYASSQSGHKNAIFCLYMMEHGCVPSQSRKNPQLDCMGPSGSGKGRFRDLAIYWGDRARVTTDPKVATSYRLNTLLNGGLEVFDEQLDENEDVERYIRAKFDPEAAEQRLLDPHSKTEIAGFDVAGPCMNLRRRGFADDANTDRGLLIECEKPTGRIPLELLDRYEDLDIQDQLALWWSEHYGDPQLLPTEAELMYDPEEVSTDCRLRLIELYLMKLAKLIGQEAVDDLQGFVAEQEKIRKKLKAETEEGQIIRAVWDILHKYAPGCKEEWTSKNGDRHCAVSTLSVDWMGNKAVLYLTSTPDGDDAHDERKIRFRAINKTMIGNRAGRTREQPNSVLQPYSVSFEMVTAQRIRTVAFRVDSMDNAFRTFLPDYDPDWVARCGLKREQSEQTRLPGDSEVGV